MPAPKTLNSAIQHALLATINNPTFEFELPDINEASWQALVSPDAERLEFVGDGLMYAAVGLVLHELFPSESPHFYTNIRNPLNSNATFTHLMVKIGAHELDHPKRCKFKAKAKVAADSFETFIAAFYMEQGFTALCRWIQHRYLPLISVARDVFHDFRQEESTNSISRKRNHKYCSGVNGDLVGRGSKRRKTNLDVSLRRGSSNFLAVFNAKLRRQRRFKRHRRTTPRNNTGMVSMQSATLTQTRTVIDLTVDDDAVDAGDEWADFDDRNDNEEAECMVEAANGFQKPVIRERCHDALAHASLPGNASARSAANSCDHRHTPPTKQAVQFPAVLHWSTPTLLTKQADNSSNGSLGSSSNPIVIEDSENDLDLE